MVEAMKNASLSPSVAGSQLIPILDNAIELHGIDQKWGVRMGDLEKKISGMPTYSVVVLETWLRGFWVKEDKRTMDEYIAPMLTKEEKSVANGRASAVEEIAAGGE